MRDAARELKIKRKFNVRWFAERAGLKSPGYLKMVVDGRRNLTVTSARQFSQALELGGRKEHYFEKLVLYNQSKDPDLKKRYMEELIRLLPRSSDFILEKRQGRYFSRPHYVCMREMVVLKDFREDYAWMAKRCLPPISPQEAKDAVQVLLELGFLERDVKGKLKQAENFVRTQDKDTEMIEAYHFHEAMIDKARHALAHLKQNERNYYALTIPLPQEMFEEIAKDFYEFRDKVVQKIEEKGKVFDEVYQLNFQFFPLTKRGRREGQNE